MMPIIPSLNHHGHFYLMIFLQQQPVAWILEDFAALFLELFLLDVRVLSCQKLARGNRFNQQHTLLLTVFKHFSSTSFTIDYGFEIFGGYLLALGIFVMLVCHHKVYALISVFILSFYELINLVRRVVFYSVMIVNWDKSYANIMSTDSDLSTVKALIIVCLVCACLGLLLTHCFMSISAQECQYQPRYIPPQQQQMTSVAYNNPAAIIPTY